MQITGATNSSSAALAATAAGNSSTLDKTSFLTLLVTQLKNQDPLSPMDNTAFVAQLAQFSSLEQMQNLNQNFQASMGLSQTLNNSVAAGLIGRQVQANGETVVLPESGEGTLGYALASEAATVSITIEDANGNIVRTLVNSDGAPGAHTMAWDGKNSEGERVPAGNYTVRVSAVDQNGADVTASSFVQGLVEGVTYRNGSAYLLVNGLEVSLSDVVKVYTDGSSAQ